MEICRICLENEDSKNLISPCNCTGSQQYVHKECLNKWQETMISNILAYPEIYGSKQLNHCSVCKGRHKTSVSTRSRLWLSLVFPVLRLIQKYWFSLLIGFLLLLCISGFLLITLLTNLVFIVLGGVSYCYLKGIRPHAFATLSGIRIGFIRVGNPVVGLAPGVLLESTSRINGGIFVRSKIIITAYDVRLGAVGFIINKSIDGAIFGLENGEAAYIGGPVSEESRHVIHTSANVQGAEKIAENLYIGGRINEIPENTMKSNFFGYSGWSSLQLDGEVRAGVWKILRQATVHDLFPNYQQ